MDRIRKRIEYVASMDSRRFRRGSDEVEGGFGRLGKMMEKMPVWARAAGASLAGMFSIQQVGQLINAASDLEESINAVTVSTGRAADGILMFGEKAADKLGLSRRQVNEYATAFSGMVEQMEAGGANVNGIYQEMLTRVSDFASVYNLDMETAFQKFQSGLAGSSEAVRRYGIDISAATVEQHALEEGIWDGVGAMTEAEKVTARYSLLMAQTDKVAGDFANTSDGLANSQRRLAAAVEELQAELGQALTPAATEGVSTLSDLAIVGRWAGSGLDRASGGAAGFLKYLNPLTYAVSEARRAFGNAADEIRDYGLAQETTAEARWRDSEMIDEQRTQQERLTAAHGEGAETLEEMTARQKAYREELEKMKPAVADYDARLAMIIQKYRIMQGLAPNWGDFGSGPGYYGDGQYNPEQAGKSSSDDQSRWNAVNGGPT